MENWIDSHITLPEHVTLSEEMENSLSHFIGFIISLAGLLYVMAHPGMNPSMVLFAATNAIMFGASGLYHYLQKGVLKKALRIVDHSAIYLLIAGSYTPVLAYIGTPITKIYTAAIWIAAALGIVLTVRFWGRFKILHVALYAVMGWSIVSIWDQVVPLLPHGLFRSILAGGITYTAGIAFYAAKPLKHHHLIWHIAVLIGSLIFFLGYSSYLLA